MFVYFLQSDVDGPVKIGFTANVDLRMSGLKTGNFSALSLIRVIEGTRATEAWLHLRFSSQRVSGEWFRFAPEMLTVVPPAPEDVFAELPQHRHAGRAAASGEFRQMLMAATSHLPPETKVRRRIAVAADIFGLSLVRARGIWYSAARNFTFEEADSIRAIFRTVRERRIADLQAEIARLIAIDESDALGGSDWAGL